MIPAVTDSTITDSYEYDAFGNSFTVSGTTPNNYLYRGEQWDPDLSLYYLRARYYNPAIGRFMSRDPARGNEFRTSSFHSYVYASDDPVNDVDPLGKEVFTEYFFNIKFVKAGAYAGLGALAIGIACEFLEDAEVIRDIAEEKEANGENPVVKPTHTPISCGGPHPAPASPGHPEGPEPSTPEPAPISGPATAGSD